MQTCRGGVRSGSTLFSYSQHLDSLTGICICSKMNLIKVYENYSQELKYAST